MAKLLSTNVEITALLW